MGYIQSVLQPGETIVHLGRIHWITNVPGILAVLVGVVGAIDSTGPGLLHLARSIEWLASLALIAFGVFLLIKAAVQRWTTEIGVTDRRVIQKTGLIGRITAEMNINQVERVEVRQSIPGRLLNYGTIRIHGSGQGMEGLANVADPLILRTSITAR